jgi:hypothetical protein
VLGSVVVSASFFANDVATAVDVGVCIVGNGGGLGACCCCCSWAVLMVEK